jgi:two-component system, NarL family, invasion response regulator UvrY
MAGHRASESTAVVRVLVVDDQRLFRRAAAALVRSVDEFELVGEAETGEQAVELAALLRPELVLMDVRLPGIDGAEATRRILEELPDARIVLVSTYEAHDLPAAISGCGARALIRKQDLDAAALQRWAQT